jgi:hypothetical protein
MEFSISRDNDISAKACKSLCAADISLIAGGAVEAIFSKRETFIS